MNFSITRSLSEKQKLEIIDLWNKEYPRKLSHSKLSDFDHYLEGLSELHHILLADESENVKGWLIYFIRDNEQCFAMLLDSSLQGKGWGSKFLNVAKEQTSELNGWVIDNDNEVKRDGTNYKSPIGFYRKNGFEILTDIHLKKNEINGIKVRWRQLR